MPANRRIARLDSANYMGHRTHFITICCDLRRPHLSNPFTATLVRDLLTVCASASPFLLHAYCLMPDHLHLLIEGAGANANALSFVRLFKSRTAFEFRKHSQLRLWEMSFYDRILRSADAIEDVAIYIWSNPVRKGLCSRPEQFPFSGSQTIDWMRRAREKSVSALPWLENENLESPV